MVLKKTLRRPGTVVHTCNPSTLADHLKSGVRDQSNQHGEFPSLLKTRKLASHEIGSRSVAQARVQWHDHGSL
ncbi:hypothetical protein AAY473_023631 [Plecturocebus cupreus]